MLVLIIFATKENRSLISVYALVFFMTANRKSRLETLAILIEIPDQVMPKEIHEGMEETLRGAICLLSDINYHGTKKLILK